MAARKYKGFVNRSGDAGVVCPRFTIRADDVAVTAYDARDVDPLLAAARELVEEVSKVRDDLCDDMRDALQPFEESEEGSK